MHSRPGVSSQTIVRVELDGMDAREVERYDMGARIRSIVEGPDGAIWVLEDDEDESTERLLKLTPKTLTRMVQQSGRALSESAKQGRREWLLLQLSLPKTSSARFG